VVVPWCLNCNGVVTVYVGDTIVWINADLNEAHTVTDVVNGILNSLEMIPGKAYSYTFTEAGSYSYLIIII